MVNQSKAHAKKWGIDEHEDKLVHFGSLEFLIATTLELVTRTNNSNTHTKKERGITGYKEEEYLNRVRLNAEHSTSFGWQS